MYFTKAFIRSMKCLLCKHLGKLFFLQLKFYNSLFVIACLLSQQLYMDVVVNEKHSPKTFLIDKLILIKTRLYEEKKTKKKP